MYLNDNGKQQVLVVGLWYVDTFARTADGWRIANRSQQKGYMHNI
jgi:hypothetical protein